MTTILTVGSSHTYPTISVALASIGSWIDDYIIEVYNNIVDDVTFGFTTTAINTLTIRGIGATKPIWTNSVSDNFVAFNNLYAIFENIQIKQTSNERCFWCSNAKNLIFKKCELIDTGGSAQLAYFNNNLNFEIENSIVTNSMAISGDPGANWRIENNTFYNNRINSKNLELTVDTSSVLVSRNNIFTLNASDPFDSSCFIFMNVPAFGIWQKNIYYNFDIVGPIWRINGVKITSFATWQSQSGENGSLIDPLFVSAGTDFNLQTGSPAIDDGVTIVGITEDIINISRPQNSVYDIGAYEFVIVPPPPEIKLTVGEIELNPITRIGYFN